MQLIVGATWHRPLAPLSHLCPTVDNMHCTAAALHSPLPPRSIVLLAISFVTAPCLFCFQNLNSDVRFSGTQVLCLSNVQLRTFLMRCSTFSAALAPPLASLAFTIATICGNCRSHN